MFLQKLKGWLNKPLFVEEKMPLGYKKCSDCDGLGHEDIFNHCKTCGSAGIVRKTYQEYVDSLPPN